jgi:hypothetical protein
VKPRVKSRLIHTKPSLSDVFGIAEYVKEYSYIDRGGLDAQTRYALTTHRHIAVHGASKQGKSWLRTKVLDDDFFIRVQRQTGSSTESLFSDALGAMGVRANSTGRPAMTSKAHWTLAALARSDSICSADFALRQGQESEEVIQRKYNTRRLVRLRRTYGGWPEQSLPPAEGWL